MERETRTLNSVKKRLGTKCGEWAVRFVWTPAETPLFGQDQQATSLYYGQTQKEHFLLSFFFCCSVFVYAPQLFFTLYRYIHAFFSLSLSVSLSVSLSLPLSFS